MYPKTHQREEAFDKLCREIVNAAQANEEDIHTAANAPFLYQRLQAQIAAEKFPIVAPPPSITSRFVAAFGAFRWAMVGAVVAAVVWMGWQWRPSQSQQIALQPRIASPTTTSTIHDNSSEQHTESVTQPKAIRANKIKTTKVVPSKPIRIRASADEVEMAEIATDFMPLTYTANRDEQQGQIVRMEMPRSMLASLGVPLANVTGDRVKADVMMSDDGVALAIRLIQPQ